MAAETTTTIPFYYAEYSMDTFIHANSMQINSNWYRNFWMGLKDGFVGKREIYIHLMCPNFSMQMFYSFVFLFSCNKKQATTTATTTMVQWKGEQRTMKMCGFVVATRSIENPKCVFFECHSSIIQWRKPQIYDRTVHTHTDFAYHSPLNTQHANDMAIDTEAISQCNKADAAAARFVFHFRLQMLRQQNSHLANEFSFGAGRGPENATSVCVCTLYNLLISEVSFFGTLQVLFVPSFASI